ncbi:S41 family peptidase [Brenneria rubrifaciens]|uniref:Tail specific protease domain-containing protein n=1 Tax=Brenneria rubrifaciens TaxID=55213 RepID=A0A4P8QVX7_9GAMM|nr:S41 family peptidase [Brenneria rubrifaciens]QCR09700.1 hypothetical protein EH207_14910 [Brenneria rubrifaciens]
MKYRNRRSLLCKTMIAMTILFGGVQHGWAKPLPADTFIPSIRKDRVDPPAQGLWLSPGYGRLFDFRNNAVTVYNYAKGACWRDSGYVNAPSLNSLIPFYSTAESSRSRVFASAPEGTQYHVRSVTAIPSVCAQTINRTAPGYIFNAITASLIDFYPFEKEHNVDWASRKKEWQARAMAARSDRELQAILTELFRGVEDLHTSISGTLNARPFSIRGFRGDDFRWLQTVFARQNQETLFLSWFMRSWMPKELEQASAALLPGTRRQALNNGLVWGRLQGNIGYLAINRMGGFSDDGDLAADRALLGPALDRALTDLKNSPALVVDISHNLGGYDEISADIASRFADKHRPAYYKRAFRNGEEQPFATTPHRGVRYLKPISLLTSELTASAAEVFTMRMREFPHVTQVGETTQGVFSDSTEKSLPNGWTLSMSTEIYRDSRGKNHEGVGMVPDIRYPVVWADHAADGYRKAILNAAELAAK